MSWLFSQALVEEFLGVNSLDGEPSVQLNGNPTQQAYLSPDKMTDFSRLSRYGMTFKPLTENRGEELLTLFQEDFRAKTLVQPGAEPESLVSDQGCGSTWLGLLAKYNHDSCSWKTPQCSLFADLEQSLQTWPRWGSMRNGECWERQMWERRTNESEFGSWPTPTAHNAKEAAYPSEFNRHTPTLASQAGGKLNPTWVEWLMGWPLEWTDLKPLEMDKSHFAPQPLGDC